MRVIDPCGSLHLRQVHPRRRPEASTKACSRLVRLPFVWRSATPQFRQRLAHSARKWKPIYEKSGKSIKNPVQNQDRLAAQNESCESRIQRRILTWGRQAAPESVLPGDSELGPRFFMKFQKKAAARVTKKEPNVDHAAPQILPCVPTK